MENLLGHSVSDAKLQKVAYLVQGLWVLQPSDHRAAVVSERLENEGSDDIEFGADLDFQAPSRFLVNDFLEGVEIMDEGSSEPSFHEGWYSHIDSVQHQSAAEGTTFNLSWLRDACDRIVKGSGSQLSLDELAMAICRVLDSEKPGEEVMFSRYLSAQL